MTDPSILVVTTPDDASFYGLDALCRRRGVPLLRVDPSDLTRHVEFSCVLRSDHRTSFVWDHRRRDGLTDITGVWLSRPLLPDRSVGAPRRDRELKPGIATAFWAALEAGGARLVNPPAAIERADDRVLQLTTAHRVGLRTPVSLVTNSSDRAREFFASFRPDAVCRCAIGRYAALAGASELLDPMTPSEFEADWTRVPIDAVLVQEHVRPVSIVRVTLIGSQVFTVRVDDPDGCVFDWWTLAERGRYRTAALPADVELAVRRLRHALGLSYAVVYLLVTADGDHVFAELNPLGNLLWVNDAVGIAMYDALFDVLVGTDEPS